MYGQAFKFWSREVLIDDEHSLVCAWQFFRSQQEAFMAFGLLRFEAGENLLEANYLE